MGLQHPLTHKQVSTNRLVMSGFGMKTGWVAFIVPLGLMFNGHGHVVNVAKNTILTPMKKWMILLPDKMTLQTAMVANIVRKYLMKPMMRLA